MAEKKVAENTESIAPKCMMESGRGAECRDMIHLLEAAGYSKETVKESVRRFWLGAPSLSDALRDELTVSCREA